MMSPLESKLFEGLPLKCIESCPRLKYLYAELHTTDVVSNALLEEGLSPHNARLITDYEVRTIGEQIGQPLNPSSQEDRKTAVRFLVGRAFEAIQDSMQDLQTAASSITSHCEGSGPLKARVPTDKGKMLVKICRSDIAAMKRTHPHATQVTLQLEEG